MPILPSVVILLVLVCDCSCPSTHIFQVAASDDALFFSIEMPDLDMLRRIFLPLSSVVQGLCPVCAVCKQGRDRNEPQWLAS